MSDLQDLALEFKIAPSESTYIIGSNSINSLGDMYSFNINSIGKKRNLYKKRIFDIIMSCFFLIFYPICFGFVKQKKSFFYNIFHVLSRKKTWVGYSPLSEKNGKLLPYLPTGVLYSTDTLQLEQFEDKIIHQVNVIYAQDYKLSTDFYIICKNFKHLGRP